jgi:DNA-binding transcriptional LysR family regulator
MLDNLSLDQLRTFIAAADAGSFSAAGRKLGRAQSVVSQTLANLEVQSGVRLFDRAGRYPVLTDDGRALLVDARAVVERADAFKARAKDLAGGLEPELSVVVDVMFPMPVLTCAVAAFQAEFPRIPLRILVEALGGVVEPVLDGRCAFGVMGSLPAASTELAGERILATRMVTVAAPQHPLAGHQRPIPTPVLGEHLQLVLTDRSTLTQGREFGVFSTNTWRLADLSAKHAFLLAGLGWGSMPLWAIQADLDAGALVRLIIQDLDPEGMIMPMTVIHRSESLPGPAGRWLIERLKSGMVEGAEQSFSTPT